MATRLHPGVYVEEVPSGARAIEAAGTSTAILVGESERGPLEPVKIRGFDDYQRLYGGYLRSQGSSVEPCLLAHAVEAFFQNGGTAAYVLRAVESTPAPVVGTRNAMVGTTDTVLLRASSPGVWPKDRLQTVLAPSSDGEAEHFRVFVRLKGPAGTGSPQLVETWDRLSLVPTDESYVGKVLERSVYIRWVPTEQLSARPALDIASYRGESDLPAPVAGTQFSTAAGGDAAADASAYSSLLRKLDGVTDASLLVLPGKSGSEYTGAAMAYAEARPLRDLFYIADLPRQTESDTNSAVAEALGDLGSMARSDQAAVYWPWIRIGDPTGRSAFLAVPPSGFVAGVYARTDARRGVWKAPAGVEATVLGIQSLDYKLLDGHQDDMNPKGLNALRLVPSAGAVVWGSRTLRPDSEWRYVPVRRTAIFLRKSIYEGIQWAVFEPNDEPLWASLRTTVGAFMEQLFRQGAFAGRTSREAYFVKCDASTTPPEDQAAGIVNLWVGFAPLRPAEFVVVKLSQKVDQQA